MKMRNLRNLNLSPRANSDRFGRMPYLVFVSSRLHQNVTQPWAMKCLANLISMVSSGKMDVVKASGVDREHTILQERAKFTYRRKAGCLVDGMVNRSKWRHRRLELKV
jgi:hypothetical protein